MKEKIECDIVQDLLLGYVDKTLNNKSNKLVEEHLRECEKCRSKVDEIKQDIKENESNQKKEIDYLKKVRRKSIIKSIFIAIGLILLVFLISFLIRNYRYAVILLMAYIITYFVREIMESKSMGDRLGISPFTMLLIIFTGLLVYGVAGFITGPVSYVIIKALVIRLRCEMGIE